MSIINSIKNHATVQHGVVARFQLLDDHVSEGAIRHALETESLVVKTPGVYATLGSQETWEQRAVIATLTCMREGYLSHESVLMLFDLLPKDRNRISRRRFDRSRNTLIHVTTPRYLYHNKDIYFHRSTKLNTYDRSQLSLGIKHVSVERAIIDAAQQLSDFELDYVLDKAISRNLITIKRMNSLLCNLHTAPGRDKFRTKTFLEPYISNKRTSDSQLEKRVEKVISQVTNKRLVRQFQVNVKGRRYRIDLSIPDLMIAIEVDGFEFHRSRMKFDDDRRRQNDLISAGWRLVRVTAAFTDDEIRQALYRILA